MIINHLMKLIRERGTSVLRVAQETGVSRSGITGLYHGHSTRYDAKTLNTLCEYFGVTVGELLEYVPDEVEVETEMPAQEAPPVAVLMTTEDLQGILERMRRALVEVRE